MFRPRTALIALAAVALSGCATFDNTDVVASVGDADLGEAEFERRARSTDEFRLVTSGGGAPPEIGDDRMTGELGRATISSWIGLQIADAADIVGAYEQGPIDSGVLCLFAISAPDAPTADGWIDRLDNGEPWSDLVAEVAPDITANGRIECRPTETLPLDTAQIADMSVDDPNRSLVFEDGSVIVIRMQSIDEIDGFELIRTALAVEPESIDAIFAEVERLDIEVSPRYGRFDSETLSVQPIG